MITAIDNQKESNPKHKWYGIINEYKFIGTCRNNLNKRRKFRCIFPEQQYWDALDRLEHFLIKENATRQVRFNVYVNGKKQDKTIRIS